jgi:hypothetical protein
MAVRKKVPSPTGKPSKKKDAVKDFEKGDASGGSRKSAYTKKTPAKKKAAPKRKYGQDAVARRREKAEKGLN